MTEHEQDRLLTSLYEEYRALIFNRIHQFVRDKLTCDDLTQETYLRAWKARDTLKDTRNVRGWLFMIASNLAIDYLRRYANNRRASDLPLEGWYHAQELVSDTEETCIIHEQVQAAFDTLARADKNMLFLYDICGYSSDEIARAIGSNRKRVLYLVDHSRKAFRDSYTRAS